MSSLSNNNNNFNKNPYQKSPCIKHNTKVSLQYTSCYKNIVRSMKSMCNAQNFLSDVSRQERLSYHIAQSLTTIFAKPITNKFQFLDRTTKYCYDNTLGENITKQSILKGIFPRVSDTKINMYAAIKNDNGDHLSNKVLVSNPQEKTDFRFLVEFKTAVEFSKTSPSIKEIVLNSEKPSQAIINPTGSNKFPDVTVNINNFTRAMDVKSGDNKNNVFANILAEIPYTENGQLYIIMNKDLSLETIQNIRSNAQPLKLLQTMIKDINHLPNIELIQKNILIQEELFKYIASNPNLKLSFYYGTIVKNSLGLHFNFHKRLSPFMNDQIFDNKQAFQKFFITAIKIYHEEVEEIFDNIKNSKEFWMGTGFEHIANDIF